MKKRTKKLLSLLLAIAMMLSLAPLSVFAEDDPAQAEPAVVEEPAGPADPETGSVVAVVYGDAMEEALLAVEQDYNLLEDERLGLLTWRGRTIPKLQDIKGDVTPEAIFSVVDEKGNETELTQDTAAKGSEYVEIIGEKPELLSEALDAIKTNNFTVYRADDLAPGKYTLKLKYMCEPYGLRNTELLAQEVTVEAGKTTIGGGDAIEVRGHANETVKVWVGTEEKTVVDSWIPYRTHKETVDKYENQTTTYEYTLNFLGYFLRKETRAFSFTTTDVTGVPVAGAEFVMVNRDELLGILEPVIGVGKEVFTTAIKNLGNPEVFSFEELVKLHANLLKQNEQGYIAIDPESAFGIVQAYLALLTDADIVGQFIDRDENGNFQKLKHPLPAVLSATSDENGVVHFSSESNVTLTWLVTIITDFGAGILENLATGNPLLQALLPLVKAFQTLNNIEKIDFNEIGAEELIDILESIPDFGNASFSTAKNTILDYANNNADNLDAMMDNWLVRGAITTIGNLLVSMKGYILDFVYSTLQNYGIVGEKFSNGNYLMFQYKVPAGEDGAALYARNPLVYTLNVKWVEPDNFYVTVADLGLVGPYVAEDFYNFVRNTTFEGPVAKAFKVLSQGYEFGSDATLYNIEITENLRKALMTGSLNLADDNNQALQGAFTAYIANATYNALGLDRLFNTRVALLNGLNDYLVGNQNTATNLMNYVNDQAKRAKSVYAGTVNEDWVFYTLDASPTTTATKLIDKSTKDIAAAFPDGSERQAGIQQNGKTVSAIVNRIGTRIEETNKAIATRVQEAVTKVFGSIFERVKTSVESVAKNVFSSILGNLFGGNNTANA